MKTKQYENRHKHKTPSKIVDYRNYKTVTYYIT